MARGKSDGFWEPSILVLAMPGDTYAIARPVHGHSSCQSYLYFNSHFLPSCPHVGPARLSALGGSARYLPRQGGHLQVSTASCDTVLFDCDCSVSGLLL